MTVIKLKENKKLKNYNTLSKQIMKYKIDKMLSELNPEQRNIVYYLVGQALCSNDDYSREKHVI